MPPHSSLSSGSSTTSVTMASASFITMQVPRRAGSPCVRKISIAHKKLQTTTGTQAEDGGRDSYFPRWCTWRRLCYPRAVPAC